MRQAEEPLKDFLVDLLPHQHKLAELFFERTSKRVIHLRGDVGLGKTTALLAIVRQLLERRPESRVLLLVPAALRPQFVERSHSVGVPGVLIDRYRLREMQDSRNSDELWTEGTVAILGQEFARQSDVRESLVKTHWDLVIADEVHNLSGARADTLSQVMICAERTILSTPIPPDYKFIKMVSPDEVEFVDWKRDDIINRDGNALDINLRPMLHEVRFTKNTEETSLANVVDNLCMICGEKGSFRFGEQAIRNALKSSPSALESILRSIRNDLTHGRPPQLSQMKGEEAASIEDGYMLEESRFGELLDLLNMAIQEIELLEEDSKLSTLTSLLDVLYNDVNRSRRVCVVTEYLATLYYLAAEIENMGISGQQLHGSMSTDERHKSLSDFKMSGQLLLATRATMTEGVDIREVTDFVLYDMPGNEVLLEKSIARMDRVGRSGKLDVHVFVESNLIDDAGTEQISLIRDFFGTPVGEG